MGLAAKYVESTILATARTGAVDLGILSPGYLDRKLRLAFTLTNVGGQMKFEQESGDLPLALRFGSSYAIFDRWLASLDAVFPRDGDPYAALGTEYRLPIRENVTVAGRLGYNSRTTGDIDGITGISCGVGLTLSRLSVDYGFVPLGGLGMTHRVSLSFKF